MHDSVDGLRITVQALLQVAAQSQRDIELLKQRQAENDHRFNVLLEEVRYLIRRNEQDYGDRTFKKISDFYKCVEFLVIREF